MISASSPLPVFSCLTDTTSPRPFPTCSSPHPMMMISIPPRDTSPHTPGQHEHSPQRHIAVGTAAPTTTDTGNTVPQRANPIQTAYAHSRKRAHPLL